MKNNELHKEGERTSRNTRQKKQILNAFSFEIISCRLQANLKEDLCVCS